MQSNAASIHASVAEDFAAVNRTILDQLASRIPLVETIGQYIIESGGKRLRPLLVLLAARALGYPRDESRRQAHHPGDADRVHAHLHAAA
jgi:octaprenyl-diphosphate synthase